MSSGKSGSSGGGGDPPAGGGDALGRRSTLRMEDEAGDAARLRRQLQAAGGGEVEAVEFAQHGGQRAAAQPLLQRPQAVGRTRGRNDDEPRRIEAAGGQPRRIEVELRLAPQHRPCCGEAAEQGGTEAGRRGIARRPRHLMQAAERQAAAERRVEGRQPKDERRPCPAASLEGLQPGAQLLQPDSLVRTLDHIHHGIHLTTILFYICSERHQESSLFHRPSKRGFSLARKALMPVR